MHLLWAIQFRPASLVHQVWRPRCPGMFSLQLLVWMTRENVWAPAVMYVWVRLGLSGVLSPTLLQIPRHSRIRTSFEWFDHQVWRPCWPGMFSRHPIVVIGLDGSGECVGACGNDCVGASGLIWCAYSVFIAYSRTSSDHGLTEQVQEVQGIGRDHRRGVHPSRFLHVGRTLWMCLYCWSTFETPAINMGPRTLSDTSSMQEMRDRLAATIVRYNSLMGVHAATRHRFVLQPFALGAGCCYFFFRHLCHIFVTFKPPCDMSSCDQFSVLPYKCICL